MKSKWNLAAFAVMALTVVAHAFGGGPEIWQPVYNSDMADVVRYSMGLVWHGLTIIFIIMAALSLIAYSNSKLSAGINLSLLPINLGIGGFALIYGFISTGGVMLLPQWILFLPMAIFTYLALIAANKED
ncbi:MAG: hypothetical protein OCD03_00045 [Hyphomicrobiales bacterium]